MAGFTDLYWTSPDGLRLHARDYAPAAPSGKLPVVCLHGLTRNARDFEAAAPHIASQGRRVLAADFRGRGQSAYAPDPMTYLPPTYAQDTVAMLDAAGIDRALFVGTSLGGLVTLIVAAIAPDRVAGAVLNDVGPRLSPVGLARIAGYTGLKSSAADWDEAAAYARAINEVAFPSYGQADWHAFAQRLFARAPDGGLTLDYDPEIAAPFRAANTDAPPLDLTPLFLGLTKDRPVLLVRGSLSDLIDAPLADEMRRLAPQMAYAEVEGVGHAPLLTEPAAKAALDAWLDLAP
jgi:pimeloyl-ACP methyl ester carboxylesterase